MTQRKDIDWAIKVDSVTKTFKLPHEKQTSLKGAALNSFKKKSYERQVALKDISFEIKKGEFVGIVGRNGSGKSTLLKIISKIYTPDKGKVHVNGSLVPFIELGVGFNPELSGRDNVYLNGALLGKSRKEMEGLYDKIVEFAELERFMDQKLKNYSSGMQVRLAFSIAIRAQSDILILDEVLAVGDTNFQQKCYDYFDEIKRQKKTIILVTHDMAAIEKYCNHALLIQDSKIVKQGSPQEIAYLYTKSNKDAYLKKDLEKQTDQREKTLKERGISVTLKNAQGKKTNQFTHGEEATLVIQWQNPKIKNVGVALMTQTGHYVFGANTVLDEFEITNKGLSYKIKLDIGRGHYMFKVGFFGNDDKEKIDFVDEAASFVVDVANDQKWGGITRLEHGWSKNV